MYKLTQTTCDLCGGSYLVEPVAANASFRGVRKACFNCGVVVEQIRMKHAQDAYRYGKKDWFERLRKNVHAELKKFYRRQQGGFRYVQAGI